MKRPRYILGILAVFLWIVALLMLYAVTPLRPWLQIKSLERQVEKNIDPTELQQWATNLLAHHRGEIPYYSDYYGTNLPPGLERVKGFGRAVEIFPHSDREPDVWVFSGGPKGAPFLVVGSPKLVTPKSKSIIPWKPGIYFVGF